MDGRRHSIDIPISRTLIALRRVRSLRDPSTNSLSKLSSFVDNLNWETNSNNAITLDLEDDVYDVSKWRNSALFNEGKEMEQCLSGHELYYGSRNSNSRLVSPLTLASQRLLLPFEGSDEIVRENKAPSEDEQGQEFTCATYSCEDVEYESSCNEKRQNGVSKCKSWHRKLDGLSNSEAAPKERSLYRNEDVGFMDSCHQGCGISNCWSRNRKFRDSNIFPNVEERPLLLLDQENNIEGVGPFTESSRSFCQKYMPKSFGELVGQNTVATSLLNAISTKRIASLYIFHGPRGTGKTSASRIFSAALNCLSIEISRKPCGLCQECSLFFSGKSSDVREVDSVRINKTEKCRLLIKSASVPPVFSRFKVYVIDECHLLHRETWAAILSCLEELPPHVVFVMVAPDLNRVPRSALSNSQTYLFQKVKQVDISGKLEKICVEERVDFDRDALDFVASKSNGSVRDAEMMLDQLSLLGKKITVPLVYEVNGVVSDDELLDLLYLALSSDASNTVKKARELLRSRIDPMQLISQLANLIMDILAGKFPDGVSEVKRKLFGADNCETDMQQLSNALKILSQTEKQLRTSKNQTTWLTVALLQLSSTGSSLDESNARLSTRTLNPQDGDFPSTSSTGDSLKNPVECEKIGTHDDRETLELVWIRAIAMCKSSSLKKFLVKRGKLVSILLTEEANIAVAELEFDNPDYVSKAEKSWKLIAGALQCLLGYNVELRINLRYNNDSDKKTGKYLKKSYFGLFNCSRRVHLRSQFSTTECTSNASENSSTPTRTATRGKNVETRGSECGSHTPRMCCHGKVMLKTIRSNDGNALSIGAHSLDENRIDKRGPNSIAHEPEISKPCLKERSKFHCWRSAMFPFRKAWQMRHQGRSERLVDYALHCGAAN
ncbi:hypothetical protein ABFS83_09G007200 [Erythranthe nasuta]